jgi:hypothetical protein
MTERHPSATEFDQRLNCGLSQAMFFRIAVGCPI